MREIYDRLIETLQAELTGVGLPSTRAAEASVQAVARVCSELGGQAVYLPKRTPWLDRARRDVAIRSAYNGRNLGEVCRRFAVSRATVYRIVKK